MTNLPIGGLSGNVGSFGPVDRSTESPDSLTCFAAREELALATAEPDLKLWVLI